MSRVTDKEILEAAKRQIHEGIKAFCAAHPEQNVAAMQASTDATLRVRPQTWIGEGARD